MCVQQTKWKGDRSKELGEGYKTIYNGTETRINETGVIVNEEMKANVMEAKRSSGPCMMVKIVTGESILNVVSAYAPQVGCTEEDKDSFHEEMGAVLRRISQHERLVIGADLNGYVGREDEGFERYHGGKAFGERNVEGVRVLVFAQQFYFILTNTTFTKRSEHLVTYKSGNNQSQIAYILVRRESRVEVMNCKVIPGKPVVTQHQPLVIPGEPGEPVFKSCGEEKEKETNTQERKNTSMEVVRA